MRTVVGAGIRRRAFSWPVFSFSLGVLIAGSSAAHAAGPVLPTGGKVVSGSATIGSPTAGALTVNQSSSQAIINWNGFSIGAGGKVQFDNGSGATLNRVTGTSISSINGLLSSTGSVYLINANGVIIGKSGVVDVGGTFVASTLDITNANFLAGGDLTFSGPSSASVVNLGKVGALGGDVALIAAKASNSGSITAANGTAGLISGYSVLMRDVSLDDGKFAVLVGGSGTSVANGGVISAANAELRAEQGNVYALAGNTAGVVRATGVKAGDGRVWLVADQGTLTLGGTIEAQGQNGAAGAIETSGQTVNIGQVNINAHGGAWTLDPVDLTIDAAAAGTIDTALNAGTSITQSTSANGSGGYGDITVAAPIAWTTSAGLTLSAFRNIAVNASISSTGGGAVTLYADNTGAGTGAVSFGTGATVSTSGAVNIFYDPASNPAGGVVNTTSYTNPTSYAANVQGGAAVSAYMLVNTVYDLQNIQNNLSGVYALGRNIDASTTASWNGGAGFQPIGPNYPGFTGTLNGQGDFISGLTINRPGAAAYIGLFATLGAGAKIQSVSLLGGTINGTGGTGETIGAVGSLVGLNNGGSISGAYTTATITNNGTYTGGLVGWNEAGSISNSSSIVNITSTQNNVGGITGANNGTISDVEFSGKVTGNGVYDVGGISGDNSGTITNSYSTGTVSGSAEFIGGITGENEGTISDVYSSAVVSGNVAGEIVGVNGSFGGVITNAYWDREGAGQSTGTTCINGRCSSSQSGFGIGANNASASSITNLEEIGSSTGISAYAQATYAGFDFSAAGPWVIFEGSTRPMLKSEYSTTITNAHQLQLMALAPTATYTLLSNVDASGAGTLSDVWSSQGFLPIGTDGNAFSGQFNGAGYAITGLTINRPSASFVGLFGITGPQTTLSNVNLASETITGGQSVGGLVGYSFGTVSNVTTTGSVAGGYAVGGVVGFNAGLVNASSSSAAVNGSGSFTGGLVGYSSGTLSNVSASGLVTSTSDFSGGLLGYNAGTLVSVSASGNVNGTQFVGGLVGWNNASFASASATGSVSGTYAVGGLAGWTTAEIDTSSASGAVTGAGAFTGGLIGFNAGVLSRDTATGQVNGSDYVGGLVGYNISTIQQLSSATGAVTGAYAVGGLVGLNNAAGSLLNVISSGTVTAADFGGGLVGWNDGFVSIGQAQGAVGGSGAFLGGFVGYNDGNIGGATAAGNVTATQAYAGGFAGFNAGVLVADSAAGAVQGVYFTGGLIGYNGGSVGNSSSTGAVAGPAYTGGLVGWNASTIETSHSTGQVAGTGPFTGGLVGYNGGAVTGSQASGGVQSNGDYTGGLTGYSAGALNGDSATGSVSGGNFVGGLTGYTNSPIQNSFATGHVAGGYAVGGLVGWNDGAIQAAYATGDVSNTSGQFTGGLIGYDNGQLSQAYASGHVTGSQFVGGVIGYGTAQRVTSDVFWDVGTTGQSQGVGNVDNSSTHLTAIGSGTGLDAHQSSTYAGFDFTNTWALQPGVSRPYLVSAARSPPPT